MASYKLARTSYADDGHTVQHGETKKDYTNFTKPLEEIHVANLHGWGIAAGLVVTADGATKLKISTGLALDRSGEHISLDEGGYYWLGPNPPAPGGAATLPSPIPGPSGVNPKISDLASAASGPMYLTIEFNEVIQNGTVSGGVPTSVAVHAPLLQLVPTSWFASHPHDPYKVVLAQVNLDGSGKVTSLDVGLRQGPSLQAAGFTVGKYASRSGGGSSIGETPVPEAGAIAPRSAGGLLMEALAVGVRAPGGTEKITLDSASGQATLAALQVQSDATIVGKLTANSASIAGDGSVGGKLTAGTASITSDLTAGGSLSSQTARVAGNATVGGGLTTSALSVTGNANVGGGLIAGTVSVTGNANVGGGLSASALSATGNATVGGNLGLNGAASIAGYVTIGDSNIALRGKLKVGHSASAPLADVGVVLAADEAAIYARNGRKNYIAVLATTDYAAQFQGPVQVSGNLTKPAGQFKIDHPLDPANKYLAHSFVESPDMMNVYNGNVVTDERGEAVVALPSYFEALNGDYRYQLTVIGQPALAYVAREIFGGQFAIKTDRGGVKVSWQVTGVRRDTYALANPVRVEEDKPEAERGLYLHPTLFGEPADRAIHRLDRPHRH